MQALGAWCRKIASEQHCTGQPGRDVGRVVIENQLVETVAEADADDLGETQ